MLDQRVLGDLDLVVSELVSNVVMHGQGAIRLRLHVIDAGDVWGEMVDAGGGFEHEVREIGPLARCATSITARRRRTLSS